MIYTVTYSHQGVVYSTVDSFYIDSLYGINKI